MKRTIFIGFILLLELMACRPSQISVNFDKVKEGRQLEAAKLIYPPEFMELWVQNTEKKSIYNLKKLYEDTVFAYFGRYFFDKKTRKQKPALFKVGKDTLETYFPDYQKIKGWEIRKSFYKKIVPDADKKKWKNLKCNSSSSSQRYVYKVLSPKKMEIAMEWTVRCGVSVMFTKQYRATYDFESGIIK